MTESRPITDFPLGLDQRQFYEEIVADAGLPGITGTNLVDVTTLYMYFVSPLTGPQTATLDALILAHVPSQGGYPAYIPTPSQIESLTGTANFIWQNTGGTDIFVMNGSTIQVNNPFELLRVGPSDVPAVSDANHAILYIDDNTGQLTQVEFGGASGAVGANAANTGVGTGVFSTKENGTMYFKGLAGTNAHTQVVAGPDDISFTVPFSSTTATGAVRIATQAEVNAGTANNLAVSPTGLSTFVVSNLSVEYITITAVDSVSYNAEAEVLIPNMTTAGNTPTAGTWLVLFSCEATTSANAGEFHARMLQDGVNIDYTTRQLDGSSQATLTTQAVVIVDGTEDISVTWNKGPSGSYSLNTTNRDLTLVKLSV